MLLLLFDLKVIFPFFVTYFIFIVMGLREAKDLRKGAYHMLLKLGFKLDYVIKSDTALVGLFISMISCEVRKIVGIPWGQDVLFDNVFKFL